MSQSPTNSQVVQSTPGSQVVQSTPGTFELMLSQFTQQLNSYLGEMPQYAKDLAIIDFIRNGPDPTSGNVVSFAQAHRQLIGKKVAGICGGSKLEDETPPPERIYAALNHHLGIGLAEKSWSICSGGGPGKAMKGLQYCLKQNLTPTSDSLSVSVLSGLDDEDPHRYTDLLIRSPGDIGIREKMIIGLSETVLIYPGNIGTNAEIFDAMLQNYVDGRGAYFTDPPMIVLVSYEDDKFKGGHFFDYVYSSLSNAKTANLSKGEDCNWLKLVVLPNPKKFSAMQPRVKDLIISNVASRIVNMAENEWMYRNNGGLFGLFKEAELKAA
jgi:predicted Rossmann-fold nucleotide-binding protein